MDMGAAGFFKHPGYKDLIKPKLYPADRADPPPVPLEAINASRYVHEPIRPAHGGKGGGFNPFSPFKPG
jgi:hypothetical protein